MAEGYNSAPDYEDISDTSYSERFMERLIKLFNTQKHTDITLKTGDVEIRCHRVVLEAASDCFDKTFSSRLDVIDMTGTDSETLMSLVKYAYSSKIRITTNNVPNLAQASHQFGFMGLLGHCERFMVGHVNPSTAISFCRFAELYGLRCLKNAAWPLMLRNFDDIVRSTEFTNMALEEIIEYISDDGLRVESECQVFEAVCRWIRSNPKREPLFPQILEYVRLPLCPMSYLSNSVASFPLIKQTESHKYLVEALSYNTGPTKPSSPRTKLRVPFHRVYLLVIGGTDATNQTCVDVKDCSAGNSPWKLLAQLPEEQTKSFSAVVVQNGIFITGGCDSSAKNSCWLFDMTQKNWKNMSPMIMARYRHGSVLHNDHVYVLGGLLGSGQASNSMERYDLTRKEWSLMEMPKQLSGVCAVTRGESIYVLSENMASLLVYDTMRDEWEQKRDMLDDDRCGGAVMVNDKIYAVGRISRTLSSYDLQVNSWTVVTQLQNLSDSNISYCQGKFVLSGGSLHGSVWKFTMDEYDEETRTWSHLAGPLDRKILTHKLLYLAGYDI